MYRQFQDTLFTLFLTTYKIYELGCFKSTILFRSVLIENIIIYDFSFIMKFI